MSPGFCSFFVITVQIIQLVTLFHAQNVLFTAKGRYQVNFGIDTKLLLVLSDFSTDATIQFENVVPGNFFKLQSISILVIRRLKRLLIVWIHLYCYLQQNWTIIL